MLHPLAKAPILQENDLKLVDGASIFFYLSETYCKELYPLDDFKDCAKVDEMICFGMDGFKKSIAMFIEYLLEAKIRGGAVDSEKVTMHEKEVNKNLETLNMILDRRKYIAGDKLTSADFLIYGNLKLLPIIFIELTKYPKLKSYFATL